MHRYGSKLVKKRPFPGFTSTFWLKNPNLAGFWVFSPLLGSRIVQFGSQPYPLPHLEGVRLHGGRVPSSKDSCVIFPDYSLSFAMNCDHSWVLWFSCKVILKDGSRFLKSNSKNFGHLGLFGQFPGHFGPCLQFVSQFLFLATCTFSTRLFMTLWPATLLLYFRRSVITSLHAVSVISTVSQQLSSFCVYETACRT